MNVIFLGIDGVLNDYNYRETVDDYYGNPIDESKMSLLKFLVDRTGALIVLTSTYREFWNEGNAQVSTIGGYINKTFAKYGLEIYSKTPEHPSNKRKSEIEAWIDDHCVEIYVIIDDADYEFDEKHFVKTSDETGFDEEACEKALKILMPDYSEPINTDEKWAEVRTIMRNAVGEAFNVWLKDIKANAYFPDSKMLVLSAHSFVKKVVADSEPLSDVLDKAIRAVFGENVEYDFEDEDVGVDNTDVLSSDSAESTSPRSRIVYNPFLAYENMDVRAFKLRERLRRMARMCPKFIFKSGNVYEELLYRLILIFVNVAEIAGITDYIRVSRKNGSIEIYSKDQIEFLVDKVATEKLLYDSCDVEKHVIKNLECQKRYLHIPFHVKRSIKSMPSDGDIYANVDSYLTLFVLVHMKISVCIKSVKDGFSTSVVYEHGFPKGVVETSKVNKKDGTYIIFEDPNRGELSNEKICDILKKTATLSGIKTSFYDYEEEDCFDYFFKNAEDYLKEYAPKTNTGFCFGKIKADGKDRFDKNYYYAKVELAFTLTHKGVAETYYNYSLLPGKNVFSDELYRKLTVRFNAWLSEKTSRGKLTTEDVKKLTSFVLNIKTNDDFEEVSLERKSSPEFKRLVDDMVDVVLENEFDYWLKHNEGEIIKLIFDVFDKKDEAIKENIFPDGMK